MGYRSVSIAVSRDMGPLSHRDRVVFGHLALHLAGIASVGSRGREAERYHLDNAASLRAKDTHQLVSLDLLLPFSYAMQGRWRFAARAGVLCS